MYKIRRRSAPAEQSTPMYQNSVGLSRNPIKESTLVRISIISTVVVLNVTQDESDARSVTTRRASWKDVVTTEGS